MKTDEALRIYPRFSDAVRRRLELGAAAYHSMPAATRSPLELLDEMKSELEDVAGWACALWARLEALRDTATDLSRSTLDPSSNGGDER